MGVKFKNPFTKWIGSAVADNAIKPITELVKAVLELFKDNKGKWSSKRTVSGVIVLAASADITAHGITTNNLILSFIGVLPLLFSVFEKNPVCDPDCCKK
jgi:integral membrane sensor domain MASE1